MGKAAKALEQMRASPKNFHFGDLCNVVAAHGYEEVRQKGSHHIYQHPTRPDLPMINLQDDNGRAKPYQVRQVLTIIDDYNLEID